MRMLISLLNHISCESLKGQIPLTKDAKQPTVSTVEYGVSPCFDGPITRF